MNKISGTLVWGAPRVAGVFVAVFLGLFALDAFDGRAFLDGLAGFAVHLAPACLVLAVVALSWRHEWVGAAGFITLAVGYGIMVGWRLDWVAVISGPLVIVGVLFLVSWRHRDGPQAAR